MTSMHRPARCQAGWRRTVVLAPMAAAVALALGTGSALGARLPGFDALATQPLTAATAGPKAASALPSGYRISMHGRLALPTLVLTTDATRNPGLARQLGMATPEGLARAHLASLASVYGMQADDVDALQLRNVQRFANGASIVRLAQYAGGVEVFREKANVLLHADGSLAAIGGHVSSTRSASASAASAFVAGAAPLLKRVLARHAGGSAGDVDVVEAGSRNGYALLELGTRDGGLRLREPARTKPVWFRTANGLLPAYVIEVQVAAPGDTDYQFLSYVVAAQSGKILFRHDQLHDAAFGYRVWAEPTPPYVPLPGPQGRTATPHPTGVVDGFQAPLQLPELVTLQNGPIANGDPWLPDGATTLMGNNSVAYADIDGVDGLGGGDVLPTTTAPGTFDRTYDTTQAPSVSTDQRAAAATHLFYAVNWLHDDFYDAGFDEASGNAQADNYGRGGQPGDRLLAEAQDAAGINNANMFTPADGTSPRMQMYVFSAATMTEATASGQVAGTFDTAGANFGPTSFDLTAALVLGADGAGAATDDGCEPLLNDVTGDVVLLERGNCTFVVKVANAQAAGAVAALIANHIPGAGAISMPVAEGGGTITIPSLSLGTSDGDTLAQGVLAGAVTMQMVRSTGVAPDGTLDTTVVAHEWGHYISNRLVGDSNGLTTQQSGGMGEGFGDFHALLAMVTADDVLVPSNAGFDGAYAVGGYATQGTRPVNSYYYGFRRYPYSTDFARNPLTFRHISDGVPLPAFPPPNGGGPNSQVHNTGEVWASMLWGCYAGLLAEGRLSFDEARTRMKQYMVGGYKLMPVSPTFTEARDSLLAVMAAQDQDDFAVCAAAFAERGAGSGAVSPDRYSTNNSGVVESYSVLAAFSVVDASLDDAPGFCDRDGVLDGGESGTLRVVLRNDGHATATGSLTVQAASAGASFPDGATVAIASVLPFGEIAMELPLTLASGSGDTLSFELVADGGDGASTTPLSFRTNHDFAPTSTDLFDAGIGSWTTLLSDGATPLFAWVAAEAPGGEAVAHGPDSGGVGLSWLVSPPLQVSASGDFVITLDHRYSFEVDAWENWDAGVIEISLDDGGSWQDVSGYIDPGYTGIVTSSSENPLGGRSAYTGASAGYPAWTQRVLDFGSALAGQSVRIRFGVGTDLSVGAPGWEIDSAAFSGIDGMPFQQSVPESGQCYSLELLAGSPQSAMQGREFPVPLAVRVRDPGGTPVEGEQVLFLAIPGPSAAASFPGGVDQAIASSDATGIATAALLTAGAGLGTHAVVAGFGNQTLQFELTTLQLTDEVFADGFED